LTLAILVAAGTPAAWLPGVGVSAPSRALAIASFFLAWLAAEGMDAASEPRSPRRRWIAAAAGAAWLLTLAGAAALATSALDGAAVAQGALETRGAPEALTGAASVARERFAARWDLEVEPELRHTAGVAILSAILWVVVLWRPRFRGLWTVALAADLAALAMHLTPACPVRNLLEENPEVRAVARAAAGGRVVRIAPQLPLTARDFELFQATLPPWYGIDDTAAYVVMPNARQAAVVRAFHPAVQEVLLGDTYLTALPKESLDGPILDLLGASAVISRAPLTHPSLDPVCERAGFFVYRRVSYRGFAWIVPRGLPAAGRNEALAAMSSPGFDPAAAALVERRGDGALPGGAGGGVCRANFVNGRTTRVDVAGCGGGFLVTTETVAPGWSAALDGAPAELYTVNGVFQGVFVPPGDHVVTLTYLPRSFVVGSAVSIAAVLAIAFAAVRLPRRGGVLP
jgi:hypothetical protein